MIQSQLTDKSLKRKEREEFAKLFAKPLKQGDISPKLDSGCTMYHKWLTKGYFTSKCFQKVGHVSQISAAEKKHWCTFLNKLCTKIKARYGRNTLEIPPPAPEVEQRPMHIWKK